MSMPEQQGFADRRATLWIGTETDGTRPPESDLSNAKNKKTS